MASRPAPRRSTKQDRDYLAYLRASNKNLTMADVYNYDQKFKEGVTNARALEGLTNYTPTISAEKVTDKSDPVSRGILNMQTQGRNMEGLFGNQVNPFGQKVDPAAARAYREMTGRNPLYKFNVDKGSQREFNIYENIQEPVMATEIAKAIPTDFATSVDKLVRGVSGDRADTSSLFTLGGRLANEGEFAYESRKGDRAGVVDDLLNAANLATYAVGGSGAALKGAALTAKLGKGYDAASTLSKASKMGRVTNPIDVGVPVAAQVGPSILDNPKAAGIAGGTGAAVLAGLLTRGKGVKTMAATAAGAVGGASIASGAAPEEAEAISFGANIKRVIKAGGVEGVSRLQELKPSQIIDLLNDPKFSKWVISRSQTGTRRAAPSYDDNAAMRHWIDNDPAAKGVGYNIARKRWRSSTFKEQRKAYINNLIETGVMTPHTDQDLIDKTKDLLGSYTTADGNWKSENAKRTFFEGASGSVEGRNAFHLAHGISIKRGGPLSPDNTYWQSGATNLKEGVG